MRRTGIRGQGSGIRKTNFFPAVLFATLALLLGLVTQARADYSFRVDENASVVQVNQDGSADLSYRLVFFCNEEGQAIDVVDIGMPNGSYDLSTAQASVNGNPLSDIRVSEYVKPYGVEVHLSGNEIQPGQKGTLALKIHVATLVYPDTKDKTYASVEFSPTWYGSKYVSGTTNLAVYFVFPEGVTKDEARYHQTPFTQAWVDSSDHVVYLFSDPEASPSTRYTFGASFPRKYVTRVASPPQGPSPLLGIFKALSGCSCTFWFWAIFIGIAILNAVRANRRKLDYLPPKLGIEGVGVKRGLTAVEAAVLEELPLSKVITMILFGLVKKGVVRVASRDPLKLELITAALSAQQDSLYDYEKSFTNAIGKDGKIIESEVEDTLVDLIKSVNSKIKGFSRKDSVAYYKTIASQAWDQVTKADTPQVRTQTLSENLEWLMMDKESDKKMQDSFANRTFILPLWWGFYTPGYAASPSIPAGASGGGGGLPSISVPELPGANFANSIVTGMQNFSSRLVGNPASLTAHVTQVTNPAAVASSGYSGGGGGHGCACACACAGCACACAGGGR